MKVNAKNNLFLVLDVLIMCAYALEMDLNSIFCYGRLYVMLHLNQIMEWTSDGNVTPDLHL